MLVILLRDFEIVLFETIRSWKSSTKSGNENGINFIYIHTHIIHSKTRMTFVTS